MSIIMTRSDGLLWHDLLSTRTYKCLARRYNKWTPDAGWTYPTAQDIASKSDQELLLIRNFGPVSLQEVHSAIEYARQHNQMDI